MSSLDFGHNLTRAMAEAVGIGIIALLVYEKYRNNNNDSFRYVKGEANGQLGKPKPELTEEHLDREHQRPRQQQHRRLRTFRDDLSRSESSDTEKTDDLARFLAGREEEEESIFGGQETAIVRAATEVTAPLDVACEILGEGITTGLQRRLSAAAAASFERRRFDPTEEEEVIGDMDFAIADFAARLAKEVVDQGKEVLGNSSSKDEDFFGGVVVRDAKKELANVAENASTSSSADRDKDEELLRLQNQARQKCTFEYSLMLKLR